MVTFISRPKFSLKMQPYRCKLKEYWEWFKTQKVMVEMHLITFIVPDFLGLCIRRSSGFTVILDKKLVWSGQFWGLRVGGCSDGGVENAQEPDDQTDDALCVELLERDI